MNKLYLTLLVILVSQVAIAQIGGNNTFEFLNLSSSARVAALGNHILTISDNDLSMAQQNPATLNPQMHQQLSFNHSFLLDGIQFGYAAYGQHIDKIETTFHAGMQYISYGDFVASDVFGNINGTFNAGEYALYLGAARQLNERFFIGVNTKFVSSQLENYNSFALLGDASLLYADTSRNLVASLVFKNFGGQLITYTENNHENVPYEVQFGLSKRLRYLPLRLSVVYRYLNRWNILYDDPNQQENTFFLDESASSTGINPQLDNFFRHWVFSGEFLFGKAENLRLRFAYNALRAREMKVTNLRSLAGFSFGIGFKVNRFRLDYGQGVYHLAGSSNFFSISTGLGEFRK